MQSGLGPSEVHVWTALLDGPQASLDAARSALDGTELARADRFHFEKDRRRYARGRAALRGVLGRYLGLAPREVAFSFGGNGKPELRGAELRFNVSHSEDRALIAVCRLEAVGVDLERLRPMPDAAAMVEKYFSPAEKREFALLAAAERDAGFLRLWTRKEAYLKARGEGLSRALDEAPEAGWDIRELDAPDGFVAALAARGRISGVRRYDWS